MPPPSVQRPITGRKDFLLVLANFGYHPPLDLSYFAFLLEHIPPYLGHRAYLLPFFEDFYLWGRLVNHASGVSYTH